jgi:hypothetical protein
MAGPVVKDAFYEVGLTMGGWCHGWKGKNNNKPPTVNHLMVIQKDIISMIFRWLIIVMWESTMPF